MTHIKPQFLYMELVYYKQHETEGIGLDWSMHVANCRKATMANEVTW